MAFGIAFVAAIAASAWRLHVHGMSRDRTDRVVHEVTRMRGVQVSAIALSDSVTAAVLFPSKPAEGVLPMATNGYMRLAGQYLLFRRFLEHNETKRMYLFTHPSLFALDLSDIEGAGLPRYTYVDSVFTRPDEKRIIADAGATPQRSIEPRFESLLKSWYPNFEPKPFSLGLWHVVAAEEPARSDPAPRLAPPLTAQVRYFLGRFEADCRAHGIECTVVEAPSRPGAPHYDMSVLRPLYPGMRFVDAHDFISFPTAAFPDGTHLDQANGMRYARAIQAYVAPLFDDRVPAWDGGRANFSQATALPIITTTLHPSEPWGAWGSAATVRLRFTAARAFQAGSFRLIARIPPQPVAAPVPVSLWLDGVKRAESMFPPNLDLRALEFALDDAEIAAGTRHELEVRVPVTINQLALGLSADGRDLGPGLASIEYCPRSGCVDEAKSAPR